MVNYCNDVLRPKLSLVNNWPTMKAIMIRDGKYSSDTATMRGAFSPGEVRDFVEFIDLVSLQCKIASLSGNSDHAFVRLDEYQLELPSSLSY